MTKTLFFCITFLSANNKSVPAPGQDWPLNSIFPSMMRMMKAIAAVLERVRSWPRSVASQNRFSALGSHAKSVFDGRRVDLHRADQTRQEVRHKREYIFKMKRPIVHQQLTQFGVSSFDWHSCEWHSHPPARCGCTCARERALPPHLAPCIAAEVRGPLGLCASGGAAGERHRLS